MMKPLTNEQLGHRLKLENRRSLVRPIVTYLVMGVYIFVCAFVIVHLLLRGDVDNALALLSGLGAIASGIAGFWFGTRGTNLTEGTPEENEISQRTISKENVVAALKSKNMTFKLLTEKLSISEEELTVKLKNIKRFSEPELEIIAETLGLQRPA